MKNNTVEYSKTYETIDELVLKPGAEFEDCEFKGIDFSGVPLKSIAFLTCRFTSCNLANQPLVNTSLRDVAFDGCNLVGINWSAPKRLERPKFTSSKLNLASFQSLKLKDLVITHCSLVDADFRALI